MHDREVDRGVGQGGHLVEAAYGDLGISGKARGDTAAYSRRRLRQDQPAGGVRDNAGVKRFAAAIIEHGRGTPGHVAREVARDLAEVHIAMTRVRVDRAW